MTGQVDEGIRLSSGVTIKKYREMEKAKDRNGLAEFLSQRLSERYILPVKTGAKHGFAIMACACLLIETLESFWNGWKTSNGACPGELVFKNFFGRNRLFRQFETHANSFYSDVRSGILHQGETKGGWRISRSRDLPVLTVNTTRTVQAVKFLNRLDASLRDYCRELKSKEWQDERWKKFRRKMNHIISNCQDEV